MKIAALLALLTLAYGLPVTVVAHTLEPGSDGSGASTYRPGHLPDKSAILIAERHLVLPARLSLPSGPAYPEIQGRTVPFATEGTRRIAASSEAAITQICLGA